MAFCIERFFYHRVYASGTENIVVDLRLHNHIKVFFLLLAVVSLQHYFVSAHHYIREL